MKNVLTLIEGVEFIAPEALKADNTPVSVDIDGFDGVTISLGVGIGGITFSDTNKIEFKLTASDDDTTFAAVADADVVGCTVGTGGIIKSLVEEQAAATLDKFCYIGDKRYLKLLADFSGTHATGTPMSATVIKTEPHVSF